MTDKPDRWVCRPHGEYPAEWMSGQIQREMCDRAGWVCEHCGMEFPHGSTKAKTARNSDGNPVILTVHHINGNKGDVRWENLLVCCQRCHLHIQSRWAPGRPLPQMWWKVPEWLIARGLVYEPALQPNLFDLED